MRAGAASEAVVSSETKSGCPGATVIMSVSPNRPAKRCLCFSAKCCLDSKYEQDVEKDRYGDMSRLTFVTYISNRHFAGKKFWTPFREIEIFEMIMPATE